MVGMDASMFDLASARLDEEEATARTDQERAGVTAKRELVAQASHPDLLDDDESESMLALVAVGLEPV